MFSSDSLYHKTHNCWSAAVGSAGRLSALTVQDGGMGEVGVRARAGDGGEDGGGSPDTAVPQERTSGLGVTVTGRGE